MYIHYLSNCRVAQQSMEKSMNFCKKYAFENFELTSFSPDRDVPMNHER